MEELEIIEEIPEVIPEESNNETVNETETIEETEQIEETQETDKEDITELLIEYVKHQIGNEIEEETEIEGSEEINNNIEESYDPQIGAILEELRSTESNIEYQSITLDDYIDNNNLQSDINDISLSNLLLIMIFISILFTSVLNFSRRIF